MEVAGKEKDYWKDAENKFFHNELYQDAVLVYTVL
jgi:hypothetical protein